MSATLHLMVGLPCSGKTTRAKELETERHALRLTPDEWEIPLFGQDATHPEHNARHDAIEALLWNLAERALTIGTSVILDFGFWSKSERDDFRVRAAQLSTHSELHFMDVPEAELLRRLEARNAALPPGCFALTEENLLEYIELFEVPDITELAVQ